MGKFPEKHLFSNRKPMLISTSVRDITTTSAWGARSERSEKGCGNELCLHRPGAAEEGTALVYYSRR